MTFIDTSALFALADQKDVNHKRAKEMLETLVDNSEELVTHNYVLAECYALMHRRLGLGSVRLIYRDIYQLCRILWISQSQHERASKAYINQDGSRYSFVDCVSFEIMKSHGIKRYFAFDDDFKRPGFEPA